MLLPDWYPAFPPVYDPDLSYRENAERGPFFSQVFPERPPAKKTWDFLGHKILSRIGVPAGPLLNARWIAFAAKLGFDVLTYKTIRSKEHAGHPLPNVLYIRRTDQNSAVRTNASPKTIDDITITNSFGMPSRSPDFLMQDIERANRSLIPGQVLIVSVTGTPERNLLSDFIETACLARAAGAKIIEANFSCPNVDKKEGQLYMSPDAVKEYTAKIAAAIHPIPLILKVGKFSHEEQMREVFLAAARSGARAICGLNSVSLRVLNEKKEPALGKGRESSGVCGSAIREEALHFTKKAKEIIKKEKLDFTLIGVGGIMRPEHFDLFFEEGADIAMSATGMMWDPYLAMRYHQQTARN